MPLPKVGVPCGKDESCVVVSFVPIDATPVTETWAISESDTSAAISVDDDDCVLATWRRPRTNRLYPQPPVEQQPPAQVNRAPSSPTSVDSNRVEIGRKT